MNDSMNGACQLDFETGETICQETVRPGMSASPFLTITYEQSWGKVGGAWGAKQNTTVHHGKPLQVSYHTKQRISKILTTYPIGGYHGGTEARLTDRLSAKQPSGSQQGQGRQCNLHWNSFPKAIQTLNRKGQKKCRGSKMLFQDVWDSKWPTSGWSHRPTLYCLEQTCACGSPFGAHGSSSCPAGTAKHGGKLLSKSCQACDLKSSLKCI